MNGRKRSSKDNGLWCAICGAFVECVKKEQNQLLDDSACHLEQDSSVRENVNASVITKQGGTQIPAFLIASSLI